MGGVAGVSDFFTINPNLKYFFLAGGGGGVRGARVSEFFHRDSNPNLIFFFFEGGGCWVG